MGRIVCVSALVASKQPISKGNPPRAVDWEAAEDPVRQTAEAEVLGDPGQRLPQQSRACRRHSAGAIGATRWTRRGEQLTPSRARHQRGDRWLLRSVEVEDAPVGSRQPAFGPLDQDPGLDVAVCGPEVPHDALATVAVLRDLYHGRPPDNVRTRRMTATARPQGAPLVREIDPHRSHHPRSRDCTTLNRRTMNKLGSYSCAWCWRPWGNRSVWALPSAPDGGWSCSLHWTASPRLTTERGDSTVVGRHGYWLIGQDSAVDVYGTAPYDGGANTLPGGPGPPSPPPPIPPAATG